MDLIYNGYNADLETLKRSYNKKNISFAENDVPCILYLNTLSSFWGQP